MHSIKQTRHVRSDSRLFMPLSHCTATQGVYLGEARQTTPSLHRFTHTTAVHEAAASSFLPISLLQVSLNSLPPFLRMYLMNTTVPLQWLVATHSREIRKQTGNVFLS